MVIHTPNCSSYWLIESSKVDPLNSPDNFHLRVVHYRPKQDLLGSKQLTWKKEGGSSSRSDGSDQRVETTSIDMTEVQRMIDSTMEKGLKFLKFIHPYPTYVEKFEYPKGFKILDFSLFKGESSLSSLEHVARFTAQCGDVNSDFHKLRLF